MSGSSMVSQSALIDRLFTRLGAFYGARFADMWSGQPLDQVKRAWAEELSGFSREELARGVEACRRRDWPPTLPEFLKLCRPAIDPERAYFEAVEQMGLRASGEDEWSSPVIFWAASRLGRDLLTSTWGSMRTRWGQALERAERDVRAGRLPVEIPERREALPAPGRTQMPAAEQRRRVAELRDSLMQKMSLQTGEGNGA